MWFFDFIKVKIIIEGMLLIGECVRVDYIMNFGECIIVDIDNNEDFEKILE